MLYNETTQPLPIPNTIIKKNRFPNTDVLSTKCKLIEIVFLFVCKKKKVES